MAVAHICNVDCKLEISPEGNKAHIMYSAEPNSAAGRYQFDVNQRIYRMGKGARKAWRESGQGSSRNVRVWDERRRLGHSEGWRGYRRFMESVGITWSDAHMLRQYGITR